MTDPFDLPGATPALTFGPDGYLDLSALPDGDPDTVLSESTLTALREALVNDANATDVDDHRWEDMMQAAVTDEGAHAPVDFDIPGEGGDAGPFDLADWHGSADRGLDDRAVVHDQGAPDGDGRSPDDTDAAGTATDAGDHSLASAVAAGAGSGTEASGSDPPGDSGDSDGSGSLASADWEAGHDDTDPADIDPADTEADDSAGLDEWDGAPEAHDEYNLDSGDLAYDDSVDLGPTDLVYGQDTSDGLSPDDDNGICDF